MTTNLITAETICDLQGETLHPESLSIFKAFEKLLTVGAYYSSDHDQYLKAIALACGDLVSVMKKHQGSIILEITAEGLSINGQTMAAQHRHVRLLHDLLIPLNLAHLEIFPTITPNDLRQTILEFQEHKLAQGKLKTFHEIIFKNLPHSVRPVSCSVSQNSHGNKDTNISSGNSQGIPNNQEMSLENNDSNPITQKMANKFKDLVSEILKNHEQHIRESGNQIVKDDSYISQTELVNLKQALYKLVEANPAPEELSKLISQAQHALSLGPDPKSVNLIFNILRKEIVPKASRTSSKKKKLTGPAQFELNMDELLEAVTALEKSGEPVVDPREGSRANQLAICLHLLLADPPFALRSGIIRVLESAVVHREFNSQSLQLCAQAFHSAMLEDKIENFEEVLALVLSIIRGNRPKMIGSFWVYMTKLGDENQRQDLWPHLVNDLLLGLEGTPRETVIKLGIMAAKKPNESDSTLQSKLERLPALQGHSASKDIFRAPLQELHPLLVLLANSSLSDWLCKELYRALRSHSDSILIKVVMAAIGENRQEHLPFYMDLIEHHADTNPPEEFSKPAAEILLSALSNASPEVRKADWVPRGLIALGKLDRDMARPLLQTILNARHLLFFKAWPEPARKAAGTALSGKNRKVN